MVVGDDSASRINTDAQLTKNTPTTRISAPFDGDMVNPLEVTSIYSDGASRSSILES